MERRILRMVALAAGLISIATSAYLDDYSWAFISSAALILLYAPVLKGMENDYRRHLMALSAIPFLLIILVDMLECCTGILNGPSSELLHVPLFFWTSSAIKGLSAFISGMMLVSLYREMKVYAISRSWSVIIAMMFALSLAVGCMFIDMITMYLQGFSIFNTGTDYPPELEYVNGKMMSTPTVAAFLDAALTVLFLKKRELVQMEGDE